MSLNMKFDLKGGKELDNALAQLPQAVQKRVLERILKKAALPIAVEASHLAPRGDGDGPHLNESVAVSTKLNKSQARKERRSGATKFQATVFVGSRDPKAHLLEFGTGERIGKEGATAYRGRFFGVLRAQPFMRPAWDLKKSAALEIIRAEIWKEIKAAARRLRKTAERLEKALRG